MPDCQNALHTADALSIAISTESWNFNPIAFNLNMKEKKKKTRKTANKPKETSDTQKKKIIELLHEYNDLKDATQRVLEALANLKCVPVGSVYATYNLPHDE
ncbi:uncharacterized protein LOC6534893 [Drosophila yakuba]|uniref:DNA repair protein SWI5 homolog n=1 Tax=Drosophila yakuba TaxID=7245 RepID=B4PFY0_DROYA|nr:uncharacterized protein LOC6534893 [Drosophila yakuba]EDW95277.1 uncharacterized protein Dyak_GE22464 [Drosophila yakuba]